MSSQGYLIQNLRSESHLGLTPSATSDKKYMISFKRYKIDYDKIKSIYEYDRLFNTFDFSKSTFKNTWDLTDFDNTEDNKVFAALFISDTKYTVELLKYKRKFVLRRIDNNHKRIVRFSINKVKQNYMRTDFVACSDQSRALDEFEFDKSTDTFEVCKTKCDKNVSCEAFTVFDKEDTSVCRLYDKCDKQCEVEKGVMGTKSW